MGGGFPTRRMHLIEGVPGTGKTTLALQFLLAAKDRGERTLYVTLSETAEELAAVAESHGWSLTGSRPSSSRQFRIGRPKSTRSITPPKSSSVTSSMKKASG